MEIKKYNEYLDNSYSNIKLMIQKLESDCANKSDLDIISNHESYEKIVKNGRKSIPFILENIDNCHVIWFRALNEITGQYPEEKLYEKGIYDTSEIRKIWKKWLIENGY